ncbi:Rhodanese domain protein [Pedosphaera parvula Ellin514]|uniref:Rhodanese domain protein n=2 Tax=Pedosphaera TaxID=1032526 RepID=B9XEV2_PEDPL|nr:Rhodanese domain protein [Pedosphaera parvula Ellin514]
MGEVLEAFPGAQRAMFRRYHIGGCSSCGFQMTETLEQVCARNNNLAVDEVLAHIRSSHEDDARILISAKELAGLLKSGTEVKLIDIRSREEYEATHIDGAILLSQPVMQEILAKWDPNKLLVLIDHAGKQGLDAAAYFTGHGLKNVRCLRGGIDAWAQEVDDNVPRYQLA